MFSPNLAEFRRQPEVMAQADERELDALAAELSARAAGAAGGSVTWGMRQLAIEA
jgi:hypothetical protein